MLQRQRKKEDRDREKQRGVWRQECPGLGKPIRGYRCLFCGKKKTNRQNYRMKERDLRRETDTEKNRKTA